MVGGLCAAGPGGATEGVRSRAAARYRLVSEARQGAAEAAAALAAPVMDEFIEEPEVEDMLVETPESRDF